MGDTAANTAGERAGEVVLGAERALAHDLAVGLRAGGDRVEEGRGHQRSRLEERHNVSGARSE